MVCSCLAIQQQCQFAEYMSLQILVLLSGIIITGPIVHSAQTPEHGPARPLFAPDPASYCDSMVTKINNYDGTHQFQKEYDSVKKYIITCPNSPWVYWEFSSLLASAQSLTFIDTGIWVKTRHWLESVLYLNTSNPEYFCQCVEAIGGTFNSVSDSTETLYWKEENCGLSIGKWLFTNTVCDTPRLRANYDAVRRGQRSDWLNDTTVPYDTTLPPLSTLDGLDTLLAKHFLYANVNTNQGTAVFTSVTASPNPLQGGTTLTFGMNQDAYVKIELFDVLGNRVSGYGYGFAASEAFYPYGNHSVAVSLSGLASGTYYARISTSFGESQTVKLVKE